MIAEILIQSVLLIGLWLYWEFVAALVSQPISKDGGPLRPPLSVGDYLWYNPGVLLDDKQ